MIEIFSETITWIKTDWKSNKFRFCIEIIAWLISIACSIVMASTVPNPPLIYIYPAWIFGCSLYAWAAFTRKSFGMLANYVLLASIDVLGYLRLIL